MAKQAGTGNIKGTLGNLTFYFANGKALVKTKNESNIDRVNGPGFEKYKMRINDFGKATRIVKELYLQYPKEKKKHGVFGKFTGIANKMFVEGLKEEEVRIRMGEVMK
jgi:hypothetical protein